MTTLAAHQAETLKEEVKEAVREATREAVIETLLMFGIDVSTPEAIQAFQKDMAYMREWRQSVEEVKSKGLLAAVGVLVTGVTGYFAMQIAQLWPHN